jgi:hypothetical protein
MGFFDGFSSRPKADSGALQKRDSRRVFYPPAVIDGIAGRVFAGATPSHQ